VEILHSTKIRGKFKNGKVFYLFEIIYDICNQVNLNPYKRS
jgi:hypothetical protein